MSKGSIIAIIASVLLVILLVGGLATWFGGNGENPFEDIFTPDDPVDEPIVFPETEYNPTFGTNFKEDFPIANLTLKDNMQVAPYAYTDTTLFSGKKITKIDAPVGTVKAVDENQYFTLWVVKSEAIKVGGDVTDYAYRQYKIYLPKEELTATTVNKWITIDVSHLNIYVDEDETLAFMKSDDPVICCYAQGHLNDFVYDLAKDGKVQASQSIYYGIYTDEYVDLEGKKLSILGDSISTYSGLSNNASTTNNTIGSNAVYYPKADIDAADETWWKQTADYTNMDVLVNNSWSGSRVLNNNGAAYLDRCVQLHDNTGDNSGTNPDVIAVYIGINDFNAGLNCGEFNELADIYTEENGYITPKSFAEAYAIMIHKMTERYGDADVFIFTLPANGTNKYTALLDEYNAEIRKIAEYFDCYLVDIAAIEGYEYAKYTNDGLHPNESGMDLITDHFARMLKAVYAKEADNADTTN